MMYFAEHLPQIARTYRPQSNSSRSLWGLTDRSQTFPTIRWSLLIVVRQFPQFVGAY